MAESADGMKYTMSFDGDTKGFDAAIAKMQAGLAALGKTQFSIGTVTAPRGSKGGGASAGPSDLSVWQRKSREDAKFRREQMASLDKAAETLVAKNKKIDEKKWAEEKKASDLFYTRKGQDVMRANKQAEKAAQSAIAGDRRAESRQAAEDKKARDRFFTRKAEAGMRENKEINRRIKDAEKEKEDGGTLGGSRASSLIVGMELGKAQQAAMGLASAMWDAAAGAGKIYSKAVEEAAVFQDIESGLKFAFGTDKYEKVFENVKKEATKTSFTLAETAELTRAMGMLNINPFEDANGKALEFKGRTGEAVSALEVFQDAATATGKSTQAVTIALREFMGGNDTSLAKRLDISLTKVHEWRKEVNKAKDVQGQFNILVGKLGGMYGGASAAQRDNWNFMTKQIPDLVQQLYANVGKGTLKAMSPGLKSFMEELSKLVNSGKAMDSLAEAFTAVGHALGAMMSAAAGMVKFGRSLIEAEPHLPAFVLGLTAMAVGATFLTASVTALGLSLAVMVAGVVTLGAGLTAVALVPTLLAGAAAAALFAGGAALMTGAFFSSKQGASGFIETFKDAKLMVDALSQAFRNWGDETTYISKSTYEELNKRGLTGWFGEIIAWATRAQQFMKGVGEGFTAAFAPFGESTAKTFDKLVDNVTRLLSALGLIAPSSETSMSAAGSAGERFGARVATALGMVTRAVDLVNSGFSGMFANAPGIIRSLGEMVFWARTLWNVFGIIGDVLSIVGTTIFNVIYLPLQLVVKSALALGAALASLALLATGDSDGAGRAIGEAKDLMGSGMGAFVDFGKAQIGNTSSIGDNMADIGKGWDQQQAMNAFADGLTPALAAVDDRRRQEDFSGQRRSSLAAPEAPQNFSAYGPRMANFSGQFDRPIGWQDPGANPMTTSSEAVRGIQSLQITVKSEIDGTAVAEATRNVDLSTAQGQGNPMYSVQE